MQLFLKKSEYGPRPAPADSASEALTRALLSQWWPYRNKHDRLPLPLLAPCALSIILSLGLLVFPSILPSSHTRTSAPAPDCTV